MKIKNINTPDFDGSNMTDEEAELKFFGPFSQAYLKAAAPDYKFGLNLGYSTSKFDVLVSLTQFSDVTIQDFQWVDSPPTSFAEADALLPLATDVYKATMTVDLSLGYEFTEKLRLTVGANNLFNIYPDQQDDWVEAGGYWDAVQMGFSGAYYYARLGFTF